MQSQFIDNGRENVAPAVVVFHWLWEAFLRISLAYSCREMCVRDDAVMLNPSPSTSSCSERYITFCSTLDRKIIFLLPLPVYYVPISISTLYAGNTCPSNAFYVMRGKKRKRKNALFILCVPFLFKAWARVKFPFKLVSSFTDWKDGAKRGKFTSNGNETTSAPFHFHFHFIFLGKLIRAAMRQCRFEPKIHNDIIIFVCSTTRFVYVLLELRFASGWS